MPVRLAAAVAFLIALGAAAQEPRPATILASYLDNPDGVSLTLPWRYAGGDDPQRALPQYDDSRWTLVAPESAPSGTGWFRRHIDVSPSVQNRPLALTFATPGIGDVYLDGAHVASAGRAAVAPLVPADRRETAVVVFRGPHHVLAVRYVYPPGAPAPTGSRGFRVSIARPAAAPAAQFRDPVVAIHGALVALPLFLALLHLALYAFDRRARENLFYAAEMLAFAVIIFHQYQTNFLSGDALRAALDRDSIGGPIVAIFFGTLTYYAVRMNHVPRAWRVVAAIGAVLFVLAYTVPGGENMWVIYFAVMLAEIVRVERSGRTVHRGGTVFFLASFVVFGAAVVLQVFINFGLLQSVGGIVEVYVFGILASAVGMSLYLANNLGRSRMIEIENERKSEELARARRLQLSMLPRVLPRVEGLDLAVATETAAEVGGDYYDVRRDGDGALLVAFGDATGHGLASGIIVTAAKTLFTSIDEERSLDAHLAGFDRALREMRLPGFLRMCLALARVSPHEAAVASAAMPPLLVRRSDSSVLELGRGDVPLGSRLRAKYEERRMPLQPGDTLLFASDGFAEQSRADGRQLGYEGVSEALKVAGAERDAQAVVTRLLAIAREFRGGEPQQDDITLLVVRVTASR